MATGAPQEPPTHRARFHPLSIARIEPLTDDSVAVTFDVPDQLKGEYRFIQGQHVTIRTELAGDGVRRSYSICSPASSQLLRIAVKRLPGGAFSEHALGRLRVGDVLDVMTPSGRFFPELDPDNTKHYAAVAAGSGITPVLSIVATALETEPRSRVTLLYANRTHRTIMFLEELEDLKNRYPERFHLIHVLSREPQDVALFSGRLDVDRMGRILDSILPVTDVDDWFLCGPLDMVSALRRLLLAAGASKQAIHAEVFHVTPRSTARRSRVLGPKDVAASRAPAAAEPTTGTDVTITLDGRQSSFRLDTEGPPVVDATLAVRSDAPYACKGGVCGTCRAKVLEGEVEMDNNWALETDEVERGYILTCQSHPVSPRLVLDYDA